VTREESVDALLELGVSQDVPKNFPSLPLDVEALLIYGSQARGDAVPGSDLDLLALVTKRQPGHDHSAALRTPI
jgi:predicted nucleotidyltransferase